MKALSLELFPADVIDNDDPEKKGRVQIYCPSFMRGWRKSDYTWAQQFSLSTGASKTSGSSSIPEVGTKVWAFISNKILFDYAYYMADAVFDNFNPHKVFEDSVLANIQYQIVNQNTLKYPYVKFTMTKNGICQFVCSDPDNPFWGVYHPTGAQIMINRAGKIFAGNKTSRVDHVVSETKLKNYLFLKLGNLGNALFADIMAKNLSFDDFYGGIDPNIQLIVPPVPPEDPIMLVDPP